MNPIAKKHKPAAGTDSWCTPEWLADALGPFDLDPCSNERSHIRARMRFTVDDDGLRADWNAFGPSSSVYCNPPYSRVFPWAERLIAHDGPWVALVKLDPTTKWWAKLMEASPVVAPFRRRIKFESGLEKDMTANFPSVLIYRNWKPPENLRSSLWIPETRAT